MQLWLKLRTTDTSASHSCLLKVSSLLSMYQTTQLKASSPNVFFLKHKSLWTWTFNSIHYYYCLYYLYNRNLDAQAAHLNLPWFIQTLINNYYLSWEPVIHLYNFIIRSEIQKKDWKWRRWKQKESVNRVKKVCIKFGNVRGWLQSERVK